MPGSRNVTIAVVAAGLIVLALLSISGTLTSPQSRSGCETQAPRPDAFEEAPIALAPTGDRLALDFGPGRRTRYASVVVTAVDVIPPSWDTFAVNVSTLSFQGRRELRGEGVTATARRVSRSEIEVTLCVDPSVQEVRAGVYQGEVRFDDPRLDDLQIGVIVFAQQTTAWVWAGIAILAGLASAVVAYFLHGRHESERPAGRLAQLLPVLLFVAAGFAAAFAQTARAYSSDRSWGADGFDGMLLAGQAIALSHGATVAATDIARAATKARETHPDRRAAERPGDA